MKRDRHAMFQRIAKGCIGGALALLLATPLLLPVAQAQSVTPEESLITIPGAGFPVLISGNLYEEIRNKTSGFLSTLTIAGVTALMNGFQVFTQRLAYDAAQAILTGAEGQTPTFYEDGFGKYIANVAADAGAAFVSDFTKEGFGIDICQPIDPLGLQLALGGVRPPDFLSKCTAARLGSAFEQTAANLAQTDDRLVSTVASMYNPNSSELALGFKARAELQNAINTRVQGDLFDRLEGEGIKPVTDFLSGKITTPAQSVKDTFSETNLVKLYREKGNLDYQTVMGNAFEVGFTQLGVLTAATFVNTLISGALQRIFDGLSGGGSFAGLNVTNPEIIQNQNVAKARLIYSDLLTPNLFTSEKRDFVIELSACPTPRGTFNCAMDDAFAAAFRSSGGSVTVAQAAYVTTDGLPPENPQYLHPDWELIPEWEPKDNTDANCYQRAYCASNLAKLRYARIIPVGWELAANSPYNKKKNGKYVTLGDAIRGFHVCNDEGEADAEHPWCKLVDPNWILSAPPFQCRVEGYGDSNFSGTPVRLQECSDAVSCLERDDKGNCTGGYGFCVAEKPVWRFGADTCEANFASCRTYTNRSNTLVSYLRNTIDYGSCSSENVGCLWYSTELDPADPSGGTWLGSLTDGPRIYLDASVETCDASSAGCTRVAQIQPGRSALNLIPNGSFEANQTEDDDTLTVWGFAGTPLTNESSVHGSRSYEPDAVTPLLSPPVALEELRSYVLSVYVRNTASTTAGTLDLTLALAQTEVDETPGIPVGAGPFFRGVGCTAPNNEAPGFSDTFAANAENTVWQRLECTFVSNTSTHSGQVAITGSDVLVDSVQLEEAEVANDYVEGLNASLATLHLKLPPEELNCTGNSATDHPSCADYAQMCRQQDTGCQGYRDIDNPTAPEIPATLSAVDLCPQQCVGYAEYQKQPSTFDLTENIDERLNDPLDDTVAAFIPALAQSCSIESVGCEEFTNIETVAQGGEDKAYFNYVRACEKPNANTETYFTWEGSDQTGYQLRTWSLIHDPSQTPAPPKILQKAGPEGFLKEPLLCNDQTWQNGTDPDCRQFFNADGAVFYRYFSQTVISSPSCTDFRKDNSSPADCEKTGGAYSAQTNDCVYQMLPEESSVCPAVNAGCRAYLGATGRNTAVVFEENFQNATTSLFTSGQLSNEAILVGDSSLKLEGNAPLDTLTVFPSAPNQLYKVSFWMKTTSASQNEGQIFVDGNEVGSFPYSVDWRRHEIGPFSVSSTNATSTIAWIGLPNITFLDEIRIERLNDVTFVVKDSWEIPGVCNETTEGLPEPQAMLGCRAYRDRNDAQITVRRFGHLCREEVIGCSAFVDTRNSANAYQDVFELDGTTSNTKVTVEAQEWESKYLGSSTTIRPADRFVYVIDEPGARCDASAQSCRAFGRPVFTQEVDGLQSPQDQAFETVYFKDDITRYVTNDGEPNMLCRKDELFCDEFKSGQTVAYFRNPGDHACEWRDGINLKADPANGIPTDGEYNGWFRTGEDLPCYPSFLAAGNTFLIQNSGDPSYTGWVGNCPIEQSECTEFRDPNDTSDPLHPSGKPYYFIKNQNVDVTSCNGEVDLLRGCILFHDLSDSRIRWSTKATYAASSDQGDTPTSPIDCTNDPDNPFCTSCKNPQIDCGAGPFPSVGVCAKCSQTPPPPGQNCLLEATQFIQTSKQVSEAISSFEKISCSTDSACSIPLGATQGTLVGECLQGAANNSNVILKVDLDRDCAEWLGCATAETVFDPVQQKYVDVCTETALCDVSKGSNAGAFCGNYVDRINHDLLKPGAFFSRDLYTSRTTGFGEKDYSGYAVPDQFQAADIQNRQVAYEIFIKDPELRNTFANDFRLAAAVSEATGLIEFPPTNDTPLDPLYPDLYLCRHTQTDRTGYFLPGTPGTRVCYFPIDALSTRSVDLIEQGQDAVDPRNVHVLADIFRTSSDPSNDLVLQRSFPPAECKANPESDSPFPNTYVKEWDFATEPFEPVNVASGYGSANFCEYGEDCACSYRKVKYGNQLTKYYTDFGQPPVAGVCSGGENDGQSCIPGETVAVAVGNGNADLQTIASSGGQNPSCPNGTCLEISDVLLVRGQFGQCLQRDYARSIAGDQGQHPCLIWNPNPILASTYDTYHYVPTAGYTPPVNAGEYYCLSHARPPFETVWDMYSQTYWDDSRKPAGDFDGTVVGDGAATFFYLPGQLSKFNYDTGYIAGQCHEADTCDSSESDCTCHDGTSNAEAEDRDFTPVWESADALGSGTDPYDLIAAEIPFGGGISACFDDPLLGGCQSLWRFTNLGQGIDGVKPYTGSEGPQARNCMIAHTQEETEGVDIPPGGSGESIPKDGIGAWESPPDMDSQLARWVQTGRGIGRSQLEYFVPVKPEGVAQWLAEGIDIDPNDPDFDELVQTALRERNFAQFQFFTKGDAYTAACSLPPWYVDGVTVGDWTDMTQVAGASNQILQQFNQNFDGFLDRSKEEILKNSSGFPVKETCSGFNDGQGDEAEHAGEDGRCYYKVWETDYRMEGVPKFQWLDSFSGVSFFDRHEDFYSQERQCSKSGFAIRAVFENANKAQNDIPESSVTVAQLDGPWNFIGFWVTSCTAGNDNYESALYLGLRVKHADVCKDLAQVVSPYSRETAAFADRVWARGSFALPELGFTYVTDFPPFGSSLSTDIPAEEPLFMTGAGSPVEGYSALKPPTFLGSGASYVTFDLSPLHKWSHLTNVFARVYRIYKYYDAGIDRTGRACIGGPNDGAACPSDLSTQEALDEASNICGAIGECNSKAVAQGTKNLVHRCNGLSGVNAGLECGGSAPIPSLDPVCHNAAMKSVGGTLVPQYSSCELRANWIQCDNGQYAPAGQCGVNSYNAKTAHEKFNAFGCGAESVQPGAGCGLPELKSKDCPLLVDNVQCIPDDFGPMAGHCGSGYEHARCSQDSDCVFTASQWWGAYDDGKPKDWNTAPTLKSQFRDQETAPGVIPTPKWQAKDGNTVLWAYNYPTTPCANHPNGCNYPEAALPFVTPDGFSDANYAVTDDMTAINRHASDLAGSSYEAYQAYEAIVHSRFGAQSQMHHGFYLSRRWPSPSLVNDTNSNDLGYVRAGLCEGAVGSEVDPNGFLTTKSEKFDSHLRPQFALLLGICEGGVNDGQFCFNDSSAQSGAWPHPNTCAPPVTSSFDPNDDHSDLCLAVAQEQPDGSWQPLNGCGFDQDVGDPFSPDPSLDNNACTRPAGYVPWSQVCGRDPDNEKCLLGYDLNFPVLSLDQTRSLTPTDVTPGLHTPSFLGLPNANPSDYDHLAYYAPRPPAIAAPDLSRVCSSPGSCPVSLMNRFTLEEQSEGPLYFGGGQAQVTMRFYGWAAHDQTPLSELNIDWGDGTVTQIADARMKNKKPYCGTTRECSNIAGLTCQSDADCPPGGGACVEMGTCAQNPSRRCSNDVQCELAGKKGDRCVIREFFGTNEDACEENFFEFSHAYTCDPIQLPTCGTEKRCSRNPNIICTDANVDSVCGSGDTCVAGLAPSSQGLTGGCFDDQTNTCRYTPKLLLKDSWNWCTGECRAGAVVGGVPTDAGDTIVRHIYGGCWDGTETSKNTSIGQSLMGEAANPANITNECSAVSSGDLDPNIRPWIVYPGSVRVGVFK